MGDLLLELLFLFLELVFEALFEFALAAIFDLLGRRNQEFNPRLHRIHIAGSGSRRSQPVHNPHPLFRPSRFHGISLLASPILTGLGMWQLGLSLRTKARTVHQIESFWNGFAFALGVALIRFYFAK